MEERGLSPRALALVAGVSQTTVNRWLNGQFHPRFKNLSRLTDALDVSADYLLGRA